MRGSAGRCWWAGLLACALSGAVQARSLEGCAAPASPDCLFAFQPAGSARTVRFFGSIDPADAARRDPPTQAYIVVHGHARDAARIFDATWSVLQRAGRARTAVLVAPLFQVSADADTRCQTRGGPPAQAGDLLWSCSSWIDGGRAVDAGLGSFEVLDALVEHLQSTWPSITRVTIAGFSAGAQLVQRHVGLSRRVDDGSLQRRHVVASPGTWLYLDDQRPQPRRDGEPAVWDACVEPAGSDASCQIHFTRPVTDCAGFNAWKHGLEGLPAWTSTDEPAVVAARYAAASVRYLVGAADRQAGPGAFHPMPDRGCAAMLQGPDRLRRALAYVQHENETRSPRPPRHLSVVPGCGHDVRCVFGSPQGAAALLDEGP
ncbi:hypothetical protein C7444_103127 [Sphaerotilus hippei]|uniref:Poly(3-hydroxybutyrate) depolymerase n=1 Tax=Sphaerotilus hippei TaxID=744406 RepID=A0A318H3B7_9BURK|nr:hypothetical protein [Sphaerotilus hippei]PXW98036.1 hypothetical protein C7444_103127 [Sphaerotilus hippei]